MRSSDQLDMLSCRDGAMQHCQQAPVSNEFSTAVLAVAIAASRRKVIYSVLQSPQDPSWSLFATASSGQVDPSSLFDLVSVVYYPTECTVSLQIHHNLVALRISRLPHLALTVFLSASIQQVLHL